MGVPPLCDCCSLFFFRLVQQIGKRFTTKKENGLAVKVFSPALNGIVKFKK